MRGSRRQFLGAIALPALSGLSPLSFDATLRAAAPAMLAELAGTAGHADDLAGDEAFWFQVQQAFAVDRSLINLNNGGVSPSPIAVMEAFKRQLDLTNQAPAYTMWSLQEPQRETVRTGLAALFGCDREEIAVTRNASESLQTLQLGHDLQRGDEVLTTTQDYPRMIATFQQRERREGIVLKQIEIPVPCEDPAEVVRRFEGALTPRTKLILMCHTINLTGQILPVREVVAMARHHGVPVLVDGAHAFAQFPFRQAELDCDYYAVSLHKWLFAPIGTGLLYVKRNKIPAIWPLMAAPPAMDRDIRKFEEIGTHPAANVLAISEALMFHAGLGGERKAARLRWLRDRWAKRLLQSERMRLHTSLDPRYSCAIGCVQIEGIDTTALQQHLWNKHRIFTVGIKHAQFEGLRVTASVYTTCDEVDCFAAAMENVAQHGLPAA